MRVSAGEFRRVVTPFRPTRRAPAMGLGREWHRAPGIAKRRLFARQSYR
jgi:hypothetical protein